MDVAGALGWTMIFPFIIGALTLVSSGIMFDTADDPRGRIITLRLLWLGIFLVLVSVVGWITAIWMGYAQGAVG